MMTPPSPPSLPEYEAVVAELVAELSRHKAAITSLSDAVEANRALQARVEAVGTMAQGVIEQANGLLAEIRRLDAPAMSSHLAAVDSAVTALAHDAQTLHQALTATDARVEESLQAANAARTAVETSQGALEAQIDIAIKSSVDARHTLTATDANVQELIRAASVGRSAVESGLKQVGDRVDSAIKSVTDVKQSLTATDTRVQEAVQAANAAEAAINSTRAALEARVATAIQAATDAKAAADAGVAAVHALPAQLVQDVGQPITMRLAIATGLLFFLIAEVAIGIMLIIVLKQ